MNRAKILLFVMIAMIGFSACKTRKKSQAVESQPIEISKEDLQKSKVIENLRASDFDFNYLSSKSRVKIKRDGKEFTLTFNVRMHKNDQIWISVNAIGGIEVARVLLNKDSVRLLDRINKQYITKDYVYLSEMLQTNIDFYLLQDLMVGNVPKKFDYTKATFVQTDADYHFEGVMDFINFPIDARLVDAKLSAIRLTDIRNTNKNVNINYADFKLVENTNFPFLISSVASSEKESLSLKLEYLKVEKVEKLEFPFNVPKKFD